MRIGELFAGYGGLGMGVKAAIGGEVAWVSDIDKGANKVLAHRFPGVPNLGDITTVDWSAVEPVDVLTGGFPCQDVSSAGKRAGIRPGTRSGLWTHFAYAIDQLRPSLVVIENVRGLLSAEAHSDMEPCPWCVGDDPDGVMRALGAVLGDLADLGFDADWHGLRAADVGAPHGRFRIFITAYARRKHGERWTPTVSGSLGIRQASDQPQRLAAPTLLPSPAQRLLPTPIVSDAEVSALDYGPRDYSQLRDLHHFTWGQYADAIARWETLTRPAPPPTEIGPKGNPRLNPAFSEWMMGLPAGWITDVPGVTRNEALKVAGNGVVPAQCEAAVRYLLTVAQVAA